MSLPIALPGLTAREAIADALYRSVNSFDTNDAALFESSFTQDAVFDLNGKVMNGISSIKSECFDIVAKLETTHFCNNVRIEYKDGASTAKLTATVQSEHFKTATGEKPDSPFFTGGAHYLLDLVKDENIWKITYWKIKLIWVRGDYSVMTPE